MTVATNVTVWTCDQPDGNHLYDLDHAVLDVDLTGIPEDWVAVEGVDDVRRTFCSLGCATGWMQDRLLDQLTDDLELNDPLARCTYDDLPLADLGDTLICREGHVWKPGEVTS